MSTRWLWCHTGVQRSAWCSEMHTLCLKGHASHTIKSSTRLLSGCWMLIHHTIVMKCWCLWPRHGGEIWHLSLNYWGIQFFPIPLPLAVLTNVHLGEHPSCFVTVSLAKFYKDISWVNMFSAHSHSFTKKYWCGHQNKHWLTRTALVYASNTCMPGMGSMALGQTLQQCISYKLYVVLFQCYAILKQFCKVSLLCDGWPRSSP